MGKMKVNYQRFKKIMGKLLVFVDNVDSEDMEDFYQDAYIEYKTFCKEYFLESIEKWAEDFYQDFKIPETNMMLASKYYQPLKDIALRKK